MKKVLGCFSKKSSNGNNAALPISANTPPYKNHVASRLFLAVLFILATVQGVWGTVPTLDDLDFGVAAITADFEGLSETNNENPSSSENITISPLSGYTPFTYAYIGKKASIAIEEGDGEPMTNKHLVLNGTNSGVGVSFERSFASKGAFSFEIDKTSRVYIGLYNGAASGTAISHANAGVYFQFNGTKVNIARGANAEWQEVLSSSDLTSAPDIIKITVIYNNTNSVSSYCDGDISLGAKTAHVYVDGTAIPTSALNDNPKDYVLNGNGITHFRVVYASAYTSRIDNIKIYDALPSKNTGYSITLDDGVTDGTIESDKSSASAGATVTLTATPDDGYIFSAWSITNTSTDADVTNNVSLSGQTASATFTMPEYDVTVSASFIPVHTITLHDNVEGDNNGSATVQDDDTSISITTQPTRTGYVLEGYYTDAECTQKIASTDGTLEANVEVNSTPWTDEDGYWKLDDDATFYAKWAIFTVTPPSGNIVFITSAASQTVRSQESFNITGSGLPVSTDVSFTIDNTSVSEKFAFLDASGNAPATNASGVINTDVYVYYTPTSSDLTDGVDIINSLTISIGSFEETISSKKIIGRHLPANFVIAAKKDNKWWALPADYESGLSSPVEIAVDDDTDPSIAFTSNDNTFELYGQASGEYVKLAMHGQSDAPLYGSGGTNMGKGDETDIVKTLGNSYLWEFIQTSTSITNAADAKYNIICKGNSGSNRSIRINAPYWGLYTIGTNELRILSLKAAFAEADVIEWGQHSAVIEVDASSISANKVIAHIGATASDAITLTQTGTSVKGSATAYNYTVNFGNDIDFAANNAALLYLEWKNGETTVAGSNVRIPRIIASNGSLYQIDTKTNWRNTPSVHVLPGVTLTANAYSFYEHNVTLPELQIYPGATVNLTRGTLIVTNLIMRNGWTRAGEKAYDVARLNINNSETCLQHTHAYADWYIDYDQYYPIAVPFPVSTADSISYVNIESAASAGVKIRYYDGEKRATNVQQDLDDNWVMYNWNSTSPAMPANLTPGVGYAMTARRPSGKAFSIVRMKMSFTDDWTTNGEQAEVDETAKNIVTLGNWGYGSSIPSYAQGWNFIANPYMALFNAPDSDEDVDYILDKLAYQDGGSIRYATIPTEDFKDYEQYPIIGHGLKPFSAFFVQAATAGEASFVTAGKATPSMPALRRAPAQVDKDIEAYIELRGDEGSDMMGLIIGDRYTAGYDINGDLTKMMGTNTNSLKTYMRYGEEEMAYVAINSQLTSGMIPVVVRIPANGEYTFSLSELSEIEDLEGLYLTDYQTDEVTNLLYDTYHFYSDKGTLDERFALNAVVGSHKTPTGIDALSDSAEDGKPIKFIYHDRMYILHNNVLYDASGKRINTINN